MTEETFHSTKCSLTAKLPLTIGGGIGQSRLCMLLIGTAHIGEVHSSMWDDKTVEACEKAGIMLLVQGLHTNEFAVFFV